AKVSRHRRRYHGSKDARAKAARVKRDTNREYMRNYRAARRNPQAALAVDIRIYVLCPLRRERMHQMCTGTRAEFI
ncbi:MAG: hypothetical protein ACKPKO_60950, partial [Candidatus Fonsibacter sp.]